LRLKIFQLAKKWACFVHTPNSCDFVAPWGYSIIGGVCSACKESKDKHPVKLGLACKDCGLAQAAHPVALFEYAYFSLLFDFLMLKASCYISDASWMQQLVGFPTTESSLYKYEYLQIFLC
jgi:hypothetical protein